MGMEQRMAVSESPTGVREACPIQPGALDGLTIMRYAHIYRDRRSGGVEQYLRRLHQGLLERHRLTILQMYLARGESSAAMDIEKVGRGRVLWVPVRTHEGPSRLTDLRKRLASVYRNSLGLQKQEGKSGLLARISALPQMLSHRGGHFRYNTAVFSDYLPVLLAEYEVNLLVMHWLSYDSDSLVLRALQSNIPFAFVNHFSNSRLSISRNRYWLDKAAAIGVVSGKEIPIDFQGRCINLLDAIDTEFFMPEKARPMQIPATPMILLPARIQLGKGHRDLIKAVSLLIGKKIDLSLCFAGAVDSEAEHQTLHKMAAAADLQGRISFLGERSAEELRDLYAASCMVVLPSYSEGLPRVLLEAQAMKKPTLSYDSGGMSEAVLPNQTGFLVKTGDVEALANKIRFLLDNEEERVRFGARGREFVIRNFAIPALVQRHEAFYLKALSKSRVSV